MTFYLKISQNSTTRHLKFCKSCKFLVVDTARKYSIFGAILVRIFPLSD